MQRPKVWWAALVAAVLVVVGAALLWGGLRPAGPKPALGLMTSLPIYWPESLSVNEALDRGAEQHWTRTELEKGYRLEPLDTLDAARLRPLKALMLAQPRPLSPQENVDLDTWVRDGGHLLLFADPFLTEESRFPLGDKRRPQDVALLSPILARWGLELTFDDRQADDEQAIPFAGTALPVRLRGNWQAVAPGAPASCAVEASGVIARCLVGKGRVLAVADAAVLARERGPSEAVDTLTQQAFAK
jgi:hypothetical protein